MLNKNIKCIFRKPIIINIYSINKAIIPTQKYLFDTCPYKQTALEWNTVPRTVFYLKKVSTWIPNEIQ